MTRDDLPQQGHFARSGLVLPVVCAFVLLLLAQGASSTRSRPGLPRISDRLAWHDSGVWLQGDLHSHYVLHPKLGQRIVSRAAATGIDFMATTEHTMKAFGPWAQRNLELHRHRYPELILLAGFEWNVPGADHATVLLEQGPDEMDFLHGFARRFDRELNPQLGARSWSGRADDQGGHDDDNGDNDDANKTWGKLDDAREALRWLRQRQREGGPESVVYLNHVSKHGFLSVHEVAALQAEGLAGFEASPGHQRRPRPGMHNSLDRHEPWVVRVGSGYDRLLAAGVPVGISASSDFHTDRYNYNPGIFSRTLVYAPERSSTGVVRALAAGATSTVVGGLVTTLETRATCAGLDDAALIHEVLTVPIGATVRYSVMIDVPDADFEGRPNRVDLAQIVSDHAGRPEVVREFRQIGLGQVRLEYTLPDKATAQPGSFYLRAIGRRLRGDGGHDAPNADYLFLTGPTRVEVVRPRWDDRVARVAGILLHRPTDGSRHRGLSR